MPEMNEPGGRCGVASRGLDQVSRFVSLVYPSPSAWIALCLIPPDHQRPEHRFLSVDRLSRFLAYARYRNAAGWGVYITPSRLKPRADNRRKPSFLDQQSVIYLDCDHPACLDHIQQRYPYPTLVVRTSQGRYQVYWRLDQPVEVVLQERLMAALAIDVDADRAATDVSRVLRLPGFWNRKPGRNNTVDIVFSRDHCVSYQSLWERVLPSRAGHVPACELPSTAGEALPVLGRRRQREELSESERDWYDVHRRLSVGHPPQEVVDWLQSKRSDKPNPRYYAQLTVQKAVQMRNSNPPA